MIISSIAFDMGMKLSIPDLTANLPLDCFKLFVKGKKKEKKKKMERKIDFTIRFYIYRNFKDESIYYVHVCIFFFS